MTETSDDYGLTADQLNDKYNPEGGGQHPAYTREDWMLAVANEDTLVGYWDWAWHRLEEEREFGESR